MRVLRLLIVVLAFSLCVAFPVNRANSLSLESTIIALALGLPALILLIDVVGYFASEPKKLRDVYTKRSPADSPNRAFQVSAYSPSVLKSDWLVVKDLSGVKDGRQEIGVAVGVNILSLAEKWRN